MPVILIVVTLPAIPSTLFLSKIPYKAIFSLALSKGNVTNTLKDCQIFKAVPQLVF